MRDIIHTDHCGVACEAEIGGQQEENRRVRGKGEKKDNFKIVGRVKVVPFWAWLQEVGEERMSRAVQGMEEAKGDIEKCWRVLKEEIGYVLCEGRKEAMKINKRTKGREERLRV
jgi:hypothetical protein